MHKDTINKKRFYKMKKIIYFLFAFLFINLSCSSESSSVEIETSYCSDEELSLRESAFSALENPSSWKFQYPSGSKEKGMLQTEITEEYKSKYLSLYVSSDNEKYLRFSLDASDEGKSKNGSSVRAELRSLNEWNLIEESELSYSFFLTSTDFTAAKFTVGQFLQHCEKKDSPLCRIEIENGNIKAVVINYMSDGTTKADGKSHKYDLGKIEQLQETSIKLAVHSKNLSIYRDGELKAEHSFSRAVSDTLKCYFKAGIYYQNKDSPEIFSEVFMRNLKVADF